MFPSHEIAPLTSDTPEFSQQERAFLLKTAHEAVASAIEGRTISLDAPSLHLDEPRGAFTTLYVRRELRGCVGYLLPAVSLYRTVIETARGAAFEDRRFPPIRGGELPELQVCLSVLSAAQPIRPEELEIGRHGLIVTQGGHRGLLLPQVAGERGWDKTTFLEQTCRKAGLPANAWQTGATVEAFTAEVFGDADLSARGSPQHENQGEKDWEGARPSQKKLKT
jgi:AmmeMemoRadiSam system protein A